MYTYDLHYINKSEDTVKSIETAKKWYDESLSAIGFFIKNPIAYTIRVPFTRLFLFFAYKSLKKSFEEVNFAISTPPDYKKIRVSYDKLDKLVSRLNTSKIKVQNVSFGFKGLANQMNDISQLIIAHHSALKKSINEINKVTHTTSSFTHISEDTLWRNRTKVYKYML